jgi:hypothetical protein
MFQKVKGKAKVLPRKILSLTKNKFPAADRP